MRPQPPCKDCFKRTFMCHCRCKGYQEFKAEMEKLADARQKENEKYGDPKRPKWLDRAIHVKGQR